MLSTLFEDLKQKSLWYYGDARPQQVARMLVTDGTVATILYRVGQACRRRGVPGVEAVLAKVNFHLHHMVVGRGVEFGPGLVLLHTIGVVINGEVTGGRNVKMEHGVTLGAEKGKCPVIGDNVFIGAGAKVFGPVRIGNDVRIGANAVVLEDVPDGATVVGVPARQVRTVGQEPE